MPAAAAWHAVGIAACSGLSPPSPSLPPPPHFHLPTTQQIQATLKKGSAAKRALAAGLLAASAAFVRARRVVEGVALQYAIQPRTLLALAAAWLAVLALAPLHALCQRLVGGKVRAALGIRRCVVSGGGSLQPHLDEFYESGEPSLELLLTRVNACSWAVCQG